MVNRISSFSDEYAFLSNFYPVEIVFQGIIFPSVEHAYQAAKSTDPEDWKRFASLKTAGEAKREGKKLNIRSDWNDIRVNVMRSFLKQKFLNPTLNKLLHSTGKAELIEGNWWNDTFWGVCKGEGKNILGKLLMELRDDVFGDF